MDIQTVKLNLVQKLLSVRSESLLNKISKLIDKEMIVGYTTAGEPLTLEAYNQRLEDAEKQIEAGNYISQEDLEKEVESWT